MTSDYKTRNSKKETRSYSTIQDSNSLAKENCKANGMDTYVVHSVSPTGAVTIMDVKGDQYVVNGQRLKVFMEPDVVPLHCIDIYTMEEEPERQA